MIGALTHARHAEHASRLFRIVDPAAVDVCDSRTWPNPEVALVVSAFLLAKSFMSFAPYPCSGHFVPGTQYFGHAPGLGDGAARRKGRVPIKDLTDAAHASTRKVIEQG